MFSREASFIEYTYQVWYKPAMEILNFEEKSRNFIEHLAGQQKSFNTLKNYRTDLNIFKGFLAEKGRSLELNEITTTELKEYNEYLNKKYTSPNSIRRRIQALRIFFDYLITEGIFDENPVKKVLVQPKVVDIPRPTAFAIVRKLKADLERKMQECKGHEQLLACRNMLLFELIYGAGLKVSHIEKLKMKHISMGETGYRVLVAPEKRDPFTVILDSNFAAVFDQYKNLLEQGKNAAGIDFNELLFNANPFKILSGGLSARGIEVIFKEFSHQLETSITAKNLRQACIFKWLNLSIPQSRIKEWMGVQPQYSLKPFLDLMQDKPEEFTYMEIL